MHLVLKSRSVRRMAPLLWSVIGVWTMAAGCRTEGDSAPPQVAPVSPPQPFSPVTPPASAPPAASPGETTSAPRLTVVVAVDMLPADFVTQNAALWSDGGFKRIMRDGAWFANAAYSHAVTVTGTGHATLATGANPQGHGIVANQWYKPGNETAIGCDDDSRYPLLGLDRDEEATGKGPLQLVGSTIGDELKRRYGADAKVWTCSMKARAAILMGGQSPDGVLWWSSTSGEFISSKRYFPALPDWVGALNQKRYPDTFFHVTWDRLLPGPAYASCDVDDAPYETGPTVLWLNQLPKTLGKGLPEPNAIFYKQLGTSPYGNDVVFELAKNIVETQALGKDGVPDLLMISLSSPDICGHVYGPNSHEYLDIVARTDRQLAAWLEYLDRTVGKNHYALALTSDHGVRSAPEYAKAKGLDAGRIDMTAAFTDLDKMLTDRYGPPGKDVHYVTALDLPWVYLNEPVLTFRKASTAEAADAVRDYLRTFPWVADAVVTQGLKTRPADGLSPLERAVAASSYDGRSGHVYIHLKPYWYRGAVCAGHGTTHPDDAHVPLMFLGPAFKPGRYEKAADIRDLAPTLSRILQTPPPSNCTGQALTEALAQ